MREVVSSMGAAIGGNDAEVVKAQVEAIDGHGSFAFEETRTDAMRAATDACVELRAKGERALLLAGSRLTCAQANDLAAARPRPAGSGITLATSGAAPRVCDG